MKVNNKYTIYNERHYCLDFSETLKDHDKEVPYEDVVYIDEETVNRWKAIQDAFFVMQDELKAFIVFIKCNRNLIDDIIYNIGTLRGKK